MRKLFPLILLLTGLCVSCVDNDYDLSKVDTDDVTIGGDDSEFRIPLATVKVDLAKMAQGAVNIQEIIAETKIWLPSPLPAGKTYVNILDIKHGLNNELESLVAQLLLQLRTDDQKFEALSDHLWKNPTYRNEMLTVISGLPVNPTETQFKTAFKQLVDAQNAQIQTKVAELAGNYLKNQLSIDPVTFDVEGFELDDSIIDLLSKNLGKPGNSLHLYGSIASLLPVSVSLQGAEFQPTNITFAEIRIEAEGKGQIGEADVTRDDLQKITKGLTIRLPVELTKYYPDKEFNLDRKDQLSIELKLVKYGSLSLDI